MKESPFDAFLQHDPVTDAYLNANIAVYNDVDWMFSDNEREMLWFDKPVRFCVTAELGDEDVDMFSEAYFLIRITGEVYVFIGDYHPKGAKPQGAYFRRLCYLPLSQMYRIRMELRKGMRREFMDDVKFSEARYRVFDCSAKSAFHHYIDAFYGITEERKRQAAKDGLTLYAARIADEDYDLAKAAYCLVFDDVEMRADGVPHRWPYSGDRWAELTEGRSRVERLTCAAAWLVAEMEKEVGEHECVRRVLDEMNGIGKRPHDNREILGRVRDLLSRYMEMKEADDDDDDDDDDNEGEGRDVVAGNIYAIPDIVAGLIHVIGNLKQETAQEGRTS